MSKDCGSGCSALQKGKSKGWLMALWIALAVNLGMFGVEMSAGASADSRALLADAIDFLGDSANYAISLIVTGMALMWRARAALAKGLSMMLFGAAVAISAVHGAVTGATPDAATMGLVGFAALIANFGVAALLFRFRDGDANMRSVWICTRNDAVGNVAVMAAALGVFGTGTAWPDLLVAGLLATLALTGGWSVVRQARGELASPKTAVA